MIPDKTRWSWRSFIGPAIFWGVICALFGWPPFWKVIALVLMMATVHTVEHSNAIDGIK